MSRHVIERALPGAVRLSEQEPSGISVKSNEVCTKTSPDADRDHHQQ